jgi:putative oxidoreductase
VQFRGRYWGVQRLFATFPNSRPGIGLLILRLASGFSVLGLWHGTTDVVHVAPLLFHYAVAGDSVLLWIGLWTPLAAIVQTAIHVGGMVLAHRYDPSSVLAAALGVALALLGPGAWSLDARLYGRKRIV